MRQFSDAHLAALAVLVAAAALSIWAPRRHPGPWITVYARALALLISRRLDRRVRRRRRQRDLERQVRPAAAAHRRRLAGLDRGAPDAPPARDRARLLLGPDRVTASDADAGPRPDVSERLLLRLLRLPHWRDHGGVSARVRMRALPAAARRLQGVRDHARVRRRGRARRSADRRQLRLPPCQAVAQLAAQRDGSVAGLHRIHGAAGAGDAARAATAGRPGPAW